MCPWCFLNTTSYHPKKSQHLLTFSHHWLPSLIITLTLPCIHSMFIWCCLMSLVCSWNPYCHLGRKSQHPWHFFNVVQCPYISLTLFNIFDIFLMSSIIIQKTNLKVLYIFLTSLNHHKFSM